MKGKKQMNMKLNIEGISSERPCRGKWLNEENKYKENETMNQNDYFTLLGALYWIARNNEMNIETVMETCALCDNNLYLNSFEGYWLNDRLTLKSLYLNVNGTIMMSVYDEKKDRFIHFVA